MPFRLSGRDDYLLATRIARFHIDLYGIRLSGTIPLVKPLVFQFAVTIG